MTQPAPLHPPFAVERIDHLVFRVHDLEASVRFYADVLGCTVVRQRPELGLVHLRAGVSMVDLVAISLASSVPPAPRPRSTTGWPQRAGGLSS
jgi:catechol 2,3-dioxygenase-like lactoylglutathione lyase family enzyme